MAGKGDKPRPITVDRKTFDSNWDKIFGKKDVRGDKRETDRKDDQAERSGKGTPKTR